MVISPVDKFKCTPPAGNECDGEHRSVLFGCWWGTDYAAPRVSRGAQGSVQGWSTAKVLQLWMVPFVRPVVNQRLRCAAEPCVKESGTT